MPFRFLVFLRRICQKSLYRPCEKRELRGFQNSIDARIRFHLHCNCHCSKAKGLAFYLRKSWWWYAAVYDGWYDHTADGNPDSCSALWGRRTAVCLWSWSHQQKDLNENKFGIKVKATLTFKRCLQSSFRRVHSKMVQYK